MRITIILILAALFSACTQQELTTEFKADQQLLLQEKEEFIYSIIHHMGRLAPKSDHQNKFSNEFDSHYQKLTGEYALEFYHKKEETGDIYFLATTIAPSLFQKKTATAGIVRYDESGDIDYYEEIFRTWKMEENELLAKSEILFNNLLRGEDLSRYYPENSGEEEYIEFPNEFVYFDVDQKKWVHTLFDAKQAAKNTQLQTSINNLP